MVLMTDTQPNEKAQEAARVYAKLQAIRSRDDLTLRPTKYLRESFVTLGGQEVPLKLRYYQVQGILHLLSMRRFILGDDTGLGKTLQTIASLCYVWEKNPDQKAIILTTKSAVPQWASEFKKFTQGVRVFVNSSQGGPSKRHKRYEQFLKQEGPTVIIMNYSLARTDFTTLQDWEGFILIGDEITAVKNPRAKVHQAVKHLSKNAARVWGLTATLIKNNLMEGYGIYKVTVPWLFKSQAAFMDSYCVTRLQKIAGSNRQIPVVVGYRKHHIKAFKKKIDPYYLGRPKHEVATELPTLVCRQVKVAMSADQAELYEEALAGCIQIGEGDDAKEVETNHLTAITRCQQIVNHPKLLERSGASKKLEMLLEMLSSGDLAEEKVIIFTRFKTMVNIIVPALQALNKKGPKENRSSEYCVRITGDEGPDERESAKVKFQDPNSKTKIVCITMAGSDAINLQAARAIIFYDTPWSAGDYLQILGRMIRIGSEHDSVYALHLVAKDTIDKRIMEVLMKKMNVLEGVLGQRLKGLDEDENFKIKSESGTKELFEALQRDAMKGYKGKK